MISDNYRSHAECVFTYDNDNFSTNILIMSVHLKTIDFSFSIFIVSCTVHLPYLFPYMLTKPDYVTRYELIETLHSSYERIHKRT